MKRKSILTLIATLVLSGVVLTGCSSDSSNTVNSKFKNWKKYCLTDEFLGDILGEDFDYWQEEFDEASKRDDFDIDFWKQYNIIDVNDDGIPEILTKTSIISFYDFVDNDVDEVDVKKPSYSITLRDNNRLIYYYDDINVAVFDYDAPRTFIVKNWLSDNSEYLLIRPDSTGDGAAYEETGFYKAYYSSTCDEKHNLNANEATYLANEFAGVDVTSLQPADYPYTLGELVEALRNY